MSKNEKSYIPPEIDQEYQKFCFELIKREKSGEKIDYGKESIHFWTKKLKVALSNRKSD